MIASKGFAMSAYLQLLRLNSFVARFDIYVLLILAFIFIPVTLQAQSQPITNISTYTQSSTPSSYVGSSDGITYNWGTGTERVLDTFTTSSGVYSPIAVADNVTVRRVDNAQVQGVRCTIFAEQNGASHTLAPSLSCDPAAIMSGRVINRGFLDVFSNDDTGSSTRSANNIERIDFVFSLGLQAPATLADLQICRFAEQWVSCHRKKR